MSQKNVIYKYGTGNPVEPNGSGDVRDGIDNLQSFDVFINAQDDTYNQRDGGVVRTVQGMNNEFDNMIVDMNSEFDSVIFGMGYGRVGTFYSGYTMENARQTLLWEVANGGDGQEYGWTGAFPKIVPPNSTPATTGGTGVGAWMSRFDPELRNALVTFSGNIDEPASWADIPKHSDPDLGPGLDAQSEALAARSEMLKSDAQDVRLALKRVSPIETRFAGGADPTGVADSTDALQACMDYCAPFLWQGSVSATKEAMGQVVAAMSGFGKFRITRPLKINPFLCILADHNGAFFGENGGFQIIADFDDKDNFALDTAPYNSAGVRVLGRIAIRGDWDNGLYTGCPGWSLHGIEVTVKAGRNIRGTLNRCMAMQSVVTKCSFEGANIGVQNSTSWGGALQLNHIRARAIPMLNLNDMTVDEQQANYLTVSGTKPVSGVEFTYPSWPDAALQDKTTAVYCSFSHPNFFHNILEGGEIAVMCTNQSRINLLDNYVEGSGYQYIYAVHSVNVKIGLRWVIAANAGLIWSRFSNIDLDASAISYLTVAGWGDIDSQSNVNLRGSRTGLIAAMPWSLRVNYNDIDKEGVVDIYVNGTGASEVGVDTNYGYSLSKPVLTLQEAIDRCVPGKYNRINVSGVVGTKSSYTSGDSVTFKVVNLSQIEINGAGVGSLNVGQSSNQIQGLPMGVSKIKISGLSVTIPLVSDNYKPFITCHGVVSLEVDDSTITGAGTLMGVKFGQAGMCNLTARNSTISCALQHNGGASNAFSWIDTAISTSVAGGSVGSSGSKKISSVLYP